MIKHKSELLILACFACSQPAPAPAAPHAQHDGMPHRFAVVADKTNVWTTEKNVAVGSVYLKRTGEKVIAWNTVCPHLGCETDIAPGGAFKCPCHNSSFRPDGTLIPGSVAPRGMDELEVDATALKDGEVRVRFQNFVASIAQKKPLS